MIQTNGDLLKEEMRLLRIRTIVALNDNVPTLREGESIQFDEPITFHDTFLLEEGNALAGLAVAGLLVNPTDEKDRKHHFHLIWLSTEGGERKFADGDTIAVCPSELLISVVRRLEKQTYSIVRQMT